MGRAYRVRGRGWLALLFVVTPVPVITFFVGQQTPLLLVGLAGALLALRGGRPVLAGVALSLCWIKPHLLFPIALLMVALLGRREAQRVFLGFAGSSALAGAVCAAAMGPTLFGGWAHTLGLYVFSLHTALPLMSSLAGVYLGLIGPPWSNALAVALIAVWAVCACLLVHQARQAGVRPGDDAYLHLVSVALGAWLLVTPFTHPADLILLTVAFPVLLGRRLEKMNDPLVRLGVGILLVAPEADLLGFRPNFWLGYSVLVPLLVLCALHPWPVLARRQRALGVQPAAP
jgi:hypothetical protein